MLNFPESFPTLATPRLVLDALGQGDAPALFDCFGDPEAMRYWSTPPWTRLDQAFAMLSRTRAGFEDRSAIRWALRRREDLGLVGTATLHAIDAQNRRAELGYMLHRAHWGQGLMGETLVAVLDWGFGPLGLHRAEADIDPRNQRSVRALERLGFAREGLLRERWCVGDEITDSVLMGLLGRDWVARPRPPGAPGS
jgi:RimJ/RimL family protein N-acetyltransferase